ncbi:MAG: CopG family antitoxin [Patescibacteria group bacterium]|nr:CopG family antitoxin [Patescibacteria group bacterium]MCL5431948.1 CopG family antitoxin [Patescibacteria group bacterium]
MKYYDLDEEEKELLEAYDKGEFQSVKNLAVEKKRLQKIARDTLAKIKNVNLRLSQKTLIKLRARAAEEGLPYQTLAASVLHRYAMGSL